MRLVFCAALGLSAACGGGFGPNPMTDPSQEGSAPASSSFATLPDAATTATSTPSLFDGSRAWIVGTAEASTRDGSGSSLPDAGATFDVLDVDANIPDVTSLAVVDASDGSYASDASALLEAGCGSAGLPCCGLRGQACCDNHQCIGASACFAGVCQ